MPEEPEKLLAEFYRSVSGAEPVQDWLKASSASDQELWGMMLD
jgi:hypothetical protein